MAATTADLAAADAAALSSFLEEVELAALQPSLAETTLAECCDRLFDDRTAFLRWCASLGVKRVDGQALAGALARASRDGRPGICETDETFRARTAWLDGDGGDDERAGEPAWPASPHPFLVFTSAGDASSVSMWVEGRDALQRDWALCVVYYGDEPEPDCLARADVGLRLKGGKFPNLFETMRRQHRYFRAFEAVLVADDDLRIGPADISALFHTRRRWDLWLLQPANHPERGKADIGELRAEPGSHRYRTTNFVEVTAPLFRLDKLLEFLREYAPRRHDPPPLVGYGIDLWFCQRLLGVDARGDCAHDDKAAVVDAVRFVNPPNEDKPNGREIDRLQEFGVRVEAWEQLCRRRGLLSSYPIRSFKRVMAEDGP